MDTEKNGVPVEIAMHYNTSYSENITLMSIILILMRVAHTFLDLEEHLLEL